MNTRSAQKNDDLTFTRFLGKLVRRWYVAAAALLGLLAFAREIVEGLGYRWPLPQPPREAFIAILSAAVIYSAFDLWRSAIIEARAVAREVFLVEGELLFDIDDRYTWTYPHPDKMGRRILVYGTIRSTGPTAVRVTEMTLIDRDGREYLAVTPPSRFETIGGGIGVGPSQNLFDPSGNYMLVPNQPRDVVVLFQGDPAEWRGATETVTYTLVVKDDHGRSMQKDFVCRVHRWQDL